MRRAQMNASKFSDRLGPNGGGRQQAKRDSFHFCNAPGVVAASAKDGGSGGGVSSRSERSTPRTQEMTRSGGTIVIYL